mgnify:CR=1 FL=1
MTQNKGLIIQKNLIEILINNLGIDKSWLDYTNFIIQNDLIKISFIDYDPLKIWVIFVFVYKLKITIKWQKV